MGMVDIRGCANLKEIFHYAEQGAIEGCSPEFARYITDNYHLEDDYEDIEERERIQRDYDDLREAVEEIEEISRRALR